MDSKNPILKEFVDAFYTDERIAELAMNEVFVVDKSGMFCGEIDRMVSVDKETKTVTLQDFKSNADIHGKETILEPFKGQVPNTKIGAYQIQLSFYAYLVEQHGYTVQAIEIIYWDYDGKRWLVERSPPLDVSTEINKLNENNNEK
jgi:CRISPR/Cas system-associated exonuclease Cas4 (RecB family)